jgi:PAS domain S-box-containing protein
MASPPAPERTAELVAPLRILESVLNSMADGVAVADLDGRLILFNPAAERMVGPVIEGSPEAWAEAFGTFLPDGVTAFPVDRLPLVRAIRGEASDDVEMFVRNAEAPRGVYLRVTGRPLRDEHGVLLGGLAVFRDVTQQRRVERALQHMAALVGSSDDAIVGRTLEGAIASWNRGAERMFGYTAAEVIGRSMALLVPLHLQNEETRSVATVRAGRSIENFETVRVKKGGQTIDVSVTISPIRDESGVVVGTSQIARDISAAKRTEAELKRAKEMAESATRMKSAFIANMRHEIRTPLAAVLGFADLLLEPRLTETERLDYITTIRRNGEHLLAVLNDVLDLSRIEAGKLPVERVACSPSQILTGVASLMRVKASEKGLAFELAYATPIPTAVHTDPTRLRQILLNLASNAVKFTERGGVRVVARWEAGPPTRLVIDVIDSGIGLSAAQIRTLFRPFAQADASTTRRHGGSGLGLGICASLAEMLGGAIKVDSDPGLGSTFTLALPIDRFELPMVDRPSEVDVGPSPAGGAVRVAPLAGSVLLAEDGPDNQLLITSVLRRRGLEVTVADDGRRAVDEAMAAWQAGRPHDLILMDMQMPELDGYGATALLRSRGYPAPIVALTAHAMAGEREHCLAAGCDDYLAKPIDRDALFAAVTRHIQRWRAAAPRAPAPAPEPAPEPAPAGTAPDPAAPLHSTMADDPEMSEIVGRFVDRLPQQAAAIRDAAARADATNLKRLVHQLKGAGGGYGFPALTELAGQLEQALLRDAAPAEVAARLDALIAACARVRRGSGAPVSAPAAPSGVSVDSAKVVSP